MTATASVRIPVEIDIQVSAYSTGLAGTPTAFDKATKAEAHYRRADAEPDTPPPSATSPRGRMDHMEIPRGAPSDEGVRAQRCGTCTNYNGFRDCEIVAGVIEPAYVCDWWDRA